MSSPYSQGSEGKCDSLPLMQSPEQGSLPFLLSEFLRSVPRHGSLNEPTNVSRTCMKAKRLFPVWIYDWNVMIRVKFTKAARLCSKRTRGEEIVIRRLNLSVSTIYPFREVGTFFLFPLIPSCNLLIPFHLFVYR